MKKLIYTPAPPASHIHLHVYKMHAPLPAQDAAMEVFVDGACTANNAKGSKDASLRHAAYGVFVADGHPWNTGRALPRDGKNTNQVAEICALRCALQLAMRAAECGELRAPRVVVKTDSMYVVNVFTKWAANWRRMGWQRKTAGGYEPVQNLQPIQETLALLERLAAQHSVAVELRHVRAHRKEPAGVARTSEAWRDWYGNMQADKLAQEASRASAGAAADARDQHLRLMLLCTQHEAPQETKDSRGCSA